MKTNHKAITAAVLGGFALGFMAPPAQAIPVFSRKYQTSCVTCHEGFPRLNSVGESFRLNGYKFADDETYIKDEPVSMGAEAYKRVWPRAIWPSDIPGLPPISMRLTMDYTIAAGKNTTPSSKFDFPHEFEVLAAGAFGNNMSFHAELEFEPSEDDLSVEGWLAYEDILSTLTGRENLLNIKVGSLGQHSFGPLTSRDNQRFTREHYLFSSMRVPGSDNRFRIRSAQPGVELYGFGGRWLYNVGVVEGNSDVSEKDVYGQLSFKIGGRGFDGSSPNNKGEGEALGSSSTGGENSLTLSVFGYRGWAGASGMIGTNTVSGTDSFWRFGAGALWTFRDLRLDGVYMLGNNEDPYATGSEADSTDWMIQASYFLFPWVIPSVRYEQEDFQLHGGHADADQSRVVAGVKILPRANVAIIIEGRVYTQNDNTTGTHDADQVAFRTDFAF